MATSKTSTKRRVRAPAPSTTLTIRLERKLDDRLQAAAKSEGKPVSQLMRDAAAAHLATLESAGKTTAAETPAPADPVPAWAIAIARRLDAIEASMSQQDTVHRDALARLDRRVGLLGEPLALVALKLGVKLPKASAAVPEAPRKPISDERLLEIGRDTK